MTSAPTSLTDKQLHHLHQRPDRQSAFLALSPRNWKSDGLFPGWVVTNPQDIAAILRSPDFLHASADHLVESAERSLRQDFPHLRRAMRAMPVLQRDEIHQKRRRELLAFLNARNAALQPYLQTIALQKIQGIRPGQLDLYQEFAAPLVVQLTSKLVECDIPPDIADYPVTEAFPFLQTARSLQKSNEAFGKLIGLLSPVSTSDADLDNRLCCMIFGVHSLITLLVENIWSAMLTSPAGAPLALPKFPVEAGVPVTARIAEVDAVIGDMNIRRGDLVRLQLQSCGVEPEEQLKSLIFGAGSHACLGKGISIIFWNAVRTAFSQRGLRLRPVEYKPKPDYFSCLYHQAIVEVLQ